VRSAHSTPAALLVLRSLHPYKNESTQSFLMFGTYIRENYDSRYYGKAINLVRRLRAAYDRRLMNYDLLLMPTTPTKATPLPKPNASREEYVMHALEMITNTAPFDLTHHPAMPMSCGMVDGLPVGLMLVGRHFDQPTIYRAAEALEQSIDWKRL
jgi:amidase